MFSSIFELIPRFSRLSFNQDYIPLGGVIYRLGDVFEDKEHQLFGEDGFEKTVAKVSEIEKLLGIYNLSQFTPHLMEK